MDEAERWIREHVEPNGAIELTHDRPWSKVRRVPTAQGVVWFKACADVQRFEARLTAELASRWPRSLPEVLAYDDDRAWLLLADAGPRLVDEGNRPEAWLEVLPLYAELQRGETPRAQEHLVHGVPDLRLAVLPERFAERLARDLPLSAEERAALEAFTPRLAELCDELAAYGIADTVQHDDLHMWNVYGTRVLDWGDSSIGHPFFSLLVPFRFLEEANGLAPGDPWFARLRAAYLEPWGADQEEACELALRLSAFAHVAAWVRQRDHLDENERREFDEDFPVILRRAVALTR